MATNLTTTTTTVTTLPNEFTGVAYRMEYFHLFKDVNVALLLSQIHYWYIPVAKGANKGKSKLRVFKNGQWYLVKSHEEWTVETGLTRRQIDRAIHILEAAGVIKVSLLGFSGRPTRHIHAINVVGNKPLQEGDFLVTKINTIARKEESHCTYDVNGLHLGVQSNTENTTDNTTETLELANASLIAKDSNPKKPFKEQVEGDNMKYEGNVSDIVSKFKMGKENPTLPTKTNWGIWRHYFQLKFDVPFMKEPTGKELGQLKQIKTVFGDDYQAIIDFMMHRWYSVCVQVEHWSDAPSRPTVPIIGYVLKHAGIIKNFWITETTTKVALVKKVNSSSIPEPKPTVVKDQPMSKEEALAFAAKDYEESLLEKEKLVVSKPTLTDVPWVYVAPTTDYKGNPL